MVSWHSYYPKENAMTRARKRSRWWGNAVFAGCLLLSGVSTSLVLAQVKPAPVVARHEPEGPSLPAPASEAAPAFSPAEIFPPGNVVLPIDLPTALQIADAGNPTIALARAQEREAFEALRLAQLQWLPNLQAIPSYLRHDGEIQNAAGLVFQTSKSNLSAMGGAILDVDSGNALFGPLIARRLADAQSAATQAVNNNVQLNVALAYLDLLRTYGQLAVNADLLARDQEILLRTREATKAELAKTGAEINRAEAEVQLRLQERIFIKGDIRVASSRLARLLLLQPTVALVPAEPAIVPITLVAENAPADDLVSIGLLNRPEVAESRSLVGASETRLRQSQLAPLMPHVQVYYDAGVFGGGQDAILHNFNGRGDGGAALMWQLNNLSLGNVASNRIRRTQVNEANYHVQEIQAEVADEVNSAVQIARARREMLDNAQEAVRQALKEFDKFYELSISKRGPKDLLDTLQPLLALQTLAQARNQYLSAVIEYNRAQFQLFTAMGRPSAEALPKACATPVAVPTVPVPWQPPK
jgi:outer membrane protein TolC